MRISKGGSSLEVFADADQLQLGAGYGGMSYERVSIYVRLGETLSELERQAKQHPATATLVKVERKTAGNDTRELRQRMTPSGPTAKEINDRFQHGADWWFPVRLLRIMDHALNEGRDGQAITKHYTRARRAHRDLLATCFRRKDLLGLFRSVVASVRKAGQPISLGDYDDTLSIANRYVVEDEDDQPRTLVSGRGPLLIPEDHAGGRAVVVPISDLDKGAVDAYLFDGTSSCGKLKLTANGKRDRIPRDYRFLYGLAFDRDFFPGEIRPGEIREVLREAR